MFNNDDRPGDTTELREFSEEMALGDPWSPGNLAVRSPEENQRLIHELQVHQVELETQNKKLYLAQTELRAARARYFNLYNLAPVGYVTMNEAGAVLETNLAAITLLGVTQATMVKRPLSDFILIEDQDIYSHYLRQLGEARSPLMCQLRMLRTDSPPFLVRLEATVTRDEGSGPPSCRIVMIDITEPKQERDEIQRARDAAIADAANSRLLSTVAHEFRNHLSLVSSSLDILDRYEDRLSIAQRREQHKLIRNASHQLKVLFDTLTTSRLL
jgi:PAS domain S-box-containing protein